MISVHLDLYLPLPMLRGVSISFIISLSPSLLFLACLCHPSVLSEIHCHYTDISLHLSFGLLRYLLPVTSKFFTIFPYNIHFFVLCPQTIVTYFPVFSV